MRPMSAIATLAALAAAVFAYVASPAAHAAPAPGPAIVYPVPRTAEPVRIGVIGSGRIGGLYGEIWSRAGHPVMFSDRDPAAAAAAAARSVGARTGTAAQAAAFGDVVLLSVPYSAMPQVGADLAGALRGKVVIDTGNPQIPRDGEMARPAIESGAGVATARYLPGAKVVRTFNTIGFEAVAREAHRPGARVATAVGGDDPAAVRLVERLVRDAGLEPVVTPGGLAGTKRFDFTPATGGVHTAPELRKIIGL